MWTSALLVPVVRPSVGAGVLPLAADGVPLDPERERSPPKAFAILQRHAARLREALTGAADVLPALLAKLDKDFQRFARQQHRRQKPSTLARLLAAHA